MCSRHLRTLLSMWKSRRKNSLAESILVAAILLNVSGVSVAGESCLYKDQAKVKPVGVGHLAGLSFAGLAA